MFNLEYFEFKSHHLTRLQIGSTSVGVPLYKDVVQINAMPSLRPSNERTRLDVNVAVGSIAITREDGAPIQVVHRPTSEGFIKIFEEPVDQLFFLKGDSPHQWTAEVEESLIKSRAGFHRFLHHVYLIAEPRLRELSTKPEDKLS